MLLEVPVTRFTPSEVHEQSFLAYFRNYADRRTDAAKSFIELSGLFCLSSVARNMTIAGMSHKRSRASDFFMLVGPPATGRKGTVTGYATEILMEYGEDSMPVLPDRDVSASGSMEAILESLEHNNGHGYTVAEEFHSQIRQYTNRNHYMESLPGKFIAAWDGNPITHVVRGKDRSISIRNPHYTIFANLQPNILRDCMNGELVANGFFARFLISFDETRYVKQIHPLDDDDSLVFEYARSTLHGINDKLNSQDTPFVAKFDNAAFSLWAELSNSIQGRNIDDEVSSFYSRCQNHLERISALYALNDWDGDGDIVIKPKHVDAAYQIVLQSIVGWESFFPFIARNETELKFKITKFTLRQSGEMGRTPRQILSQNTNLGKSHGGGMTRYELCQFIDSCTDEDGLVIECNGETMTPASFSKTLDGNYDMITIKLMPMTPEELVNYDDVVSIDN